MLATKLSHNSRSFLLRLCAVLLMLGVVLTLADGAARADQFKENEVKAVFLYNLTNFISWPQEVFTSPQSEFRLVIFGQDPFGSVLDQIVQGEKAMGTHPIRIQRLKAIEEIEACHLLYVSAAAQHQWTRILESLNGRAVVTVSDGPRFAQNGGMINLVRKAQRINIEINADLMKQNGFSVSAKLLKLSAVIEN
ncbi:MAG: YfiR family protein [Desulfobacterales bacterium]